MRRLSRSVEERFWAKVDKSGECWEWTAGRNTQGYGNFYLDGQMRGAHRFSFVMAEGPVPEGMIVDHRCYNRLCVNPSHLRVVTPKQNIENRAGPQPNTASGIRGVHYNRKRDCWTARLKHEQRTVYIGSFSTKEAAGEAARQARNAFFTHNDMDRKSA